MLADYHMHTYFSDDSTYPMEDMVKDAIRLGLSEICITDHCEYVGKWDEKEQELLERAGADEGGKRQAYGTRDIEEAGQPAGLPQNAGETRSPSMVTGSVSGLPQNAGELLVSDETSRKVARPRLPVSLPLPEYIAKVRTMQQEYGDQITIRTGVEFGLQKHTIPLFNYVYKLYKYDFDFIILSVHQVENKELWQDFQDGRTQEQYNKLYYEELLYVVRHFKSYSVLGHLDLIARYDKRGSLAFSKIRPYVEEILKIVLMDGKGIELNASSHRYGLPDTTPQRDILKLYRQMGGKIITIGTDSHSPRQMGSYIEESQEILRSLGFKAFCTYEHMKPVFHDL